MYSAVLSSVRCVWEHIRNQNIPVWCTNISCSHFIRNTCKNIQRGILCSSNIHITKIYSTHCSSY